MAESENKDAGSKSFKLRLPERERVDTTQGTFYARHMAISDFDAFKAYFAKEKSDVDLKLLGELALKSLVCTTAGPDKTVGITEHIYTQLSDNDIKALSEAVAKACNLGPLPEGEPVSMLGSLMFDQMSEQAKRITESTAQIQQTLAKHFGSLSKTVKAALGESMLDLSVARESLKFSPAVEALYKAQSDQERMFGDLTKGLHTESDKRIDYEPVPLRNLIPKFEETPAGRAALAGEESARQLREVAGLVGDMAEKLGKLHTVFLTEVMPQWTENLKQASEATNVTLNQAEHSLVWAKRGIFASIVVTIVMTGWQIWVAHDYQSDNDAQQKITESLLKQQIQAVQETNKQLAENSRLLKEELSKMKQYREEQRKTDINPSEKRQSH